MIAVMQTYDEKKVTIPKIVCYVYNKMPQPPWFEFLAEHIVGLVEEMQIFKETINLQIDCIQVLGGRQGRTE